MPLHLDANAAAADRILPVNRVKPHTCFTRPDRERLHEDGRRRLRQAARRGADPLVRTGRDARPASSTASPRCAAPAACSAASASVESPAGDVVRVAALDADDVGGTAERELTEFASALVPPLPFDEIDVLIIEHGGKDIRGTTIDPNVTGRFWVQRPRRPRRPACGDHRAAVGVTEISEGNVLGIGFADFIPASLAAADRLAARPTSTASPPGRPACAGRGCRWCCPTRSRASRRRCRCAGIAIDRRNGSCASTRRCTSRSAGSAMPLLADLPANVRVVASGTDPTSRR